MNQYRDFDNDQGRFGYAEGAQFLSQLHENGQHYIPIVDSAIYVPNPQNTSDAYPIFNRGNDSDAFMLNPDGSLYIGEVWPGKPPFSEQNFPFLWFREFSMSRDFWDILLFEISESGMLTLRSWVQDTLFFLTGSALFSMVQVHLIGGATRWSCGTRTSLLMVFGSI